MSPTITDGLPLVMDCASNAWIWRMSHCNADRLSPGAGVTAGAVSEPLASGWSFLTLVAPCAVAVTESMFEADCRLLAKSLRLDFAMATPICS